MEPYFQWLGPDRLFPRLGRAMEGVMANRAEAAVQIDRSLRQATAAREVPGVVAMAAGRDGVLYQGAFGVRDLGSGAAMTPDTVFRIHSMTKAITCVAAMQQVEAGRLALDGPVP